MFLDLASGSGLIACVSADRVVASREIDHRIADHELPPAVEAVLAEAKWPYKDLTHIACVIGPGGFTSLRVAVTLANTLSDQLGIPSSGIHLSDLYATRSFETRLCGAPQDDTIKGLVWLHSTKRTSLFARTFGIPDSPWKEPTLITTEELIAYRSSLTATKWCGELIPEHQSFVETLYRASLRRLADTLPSFLVTQTCQQQILLPWYGRGW